MGQARDKGEKSCPRARDSLGQNIEAKNDKSCYANPSDADSDPAVDPSLDRVAKWYAEAMTLPGAIDYKSLCPDYHQGCFTCPDGDLGKLHFCAKFSRADDGAAVLQ
ncbi:MAG: hypothetical protein LBN33_11525 [Desulfovibrio sp.]|nr:hypothetical protein [Desulfovibrio sp.]